MGLMVRGAVDCPDVVDGAVDCPDGRPLVHAG